MTADTAKFFNPVKPANSLFSILGTDWQYN
jgi:hypothetical protein